MAIHFKNEIYDTVVNRLKFEHTRLTFQCLMAGEEPFDMFNRRNSTDCHQYENKEQYNILDQLREVLGSQIEASNKIIQF